MVKGGKFLFWLLLMWGGLAVESLAEEVIDKLLKISVQNGEIDYSYLKTMESIVDARLKEMSNLDLSANSEAFKKAFWINAYNLSLIKLILRHFPIKSIKAIPRHQCWDWKGWTYDGQLWSLNDIELKIFRPMCDPRVFFAIHSASKSGPKLSGAFYKAEQIEEQLNDATKAFMRDKVRGLKIRPKLNFLGVENENPEVFISQIFKFYLEDFVKKSGSIPEFLNLYGDEKFRKIFSSGRMVDWHYLEFDWTLNGR